MKLFNKDHCSYFPEYIRSIYLGDMCYEHDVRYADQSKSRWVADRELLVDVYSRLRYTERGAWVALPTALTMWLGVRTFGWIWYKG